MIIKDNEQPFSNSILVLKEKSTTDLYEIAFEDNLNFGNFSPTFSVNSGKSEN